MKRVFRSIGNKIKGSTSRHKKQKLAQAVRLCFEQLELRRMLSISAAPGGPYTVDEGSSVHLSGLSSTDDEGTITSYKWDLNYDGSTFHTGVTGGAFTYHAADGPVSRTVALRVTDDNGHVDTQTTTLTINNVAPTITLTGADSTDEGASYNLSWSKTDPGSDTISGWEINWGDGTTHTTTAGNVTSSAHTYTAAGDRTITVTATDEDGTYDATKDITVNTIVPQVTLSGDTVIDEGGTAHINFSATDAGGDALDGWTIDWGDGNVDFTDSNVSSASHDYADDGEYTITATALSTDGDTGEATLGLTVNNVDPSVAITGTPETSPEGSEISLGSTASDPGDDTLTYGWTVYKNDAHYTLPDGTDITNNTFAFTPDDNGSYVVRLTVQDEDGGSTTENSSAIDVTNVDPTATIAGEPEENINEGDSVTLTATPSDVGTADEFTYAWSVTKNGDAYDVGEVDTTGAEFTFTPRDNGTFVATCVVSDDDGGDFSVDSADIEVDNVAPEGTITGAPETDVPEGSEITLTATPTDAGADDSFTYAWSVTKGGEAYDLGESAVTDQAEFSFTPNDDGVYVASCTVTDDDGDSVGLGTDDITVVNANPTGTISGIPEETINEGDEVTLTANPLDAGSADTFTYSWSVTKDGEAYDLGETATDQPTLTFTPNDNGEYIATVTISDDDGGETTIDSSASPIEVANLNPHVSIDDAPETSPEGAAINLTSTVTDAGSADTFTYAWSVTKNGEAYDLGETDTTTDSLSFTPDDNGEYVATLTVHDDDLGERSDAVVIAITNADPTATISGEPDDSIVEGTEVTLTATPHDDGSADTFSYAWSVKKDGEDYPILQPNALAGNEFSFTPRDNGTFVVTCVVSDDDGGSVSVDSQEIAVTNATPTVSISGVPQGQSGDVSLTLPNQGADTVYSDGGVLDDPSTLYAADWFSTLYAGVMKWQLPEGLSADDVTGATLTFTVVGTANRQVNLYAFDSESASVVAGDYTAINDSTTVVATDVMSDDSQPVTISGAALENAIKDAINAGRDHVSLALRLADNTSVGGPATLGTVGGPASETPPTLTVATGTGEATVEEGSTTTLTATGADAGADDTLSYAWTVTRNGEAYDLTGQTTDQSTFDFVPSDQGDYAITATVTDDDGDSSSDTVNITATNVAPTGSITGVPEESIEGSPMTLTAHGSDVGVNDTLSYSWSVTRNGDAYDLGETTTNEADLTFTPDDNGDYVATVTISDGDGGSTDVSTDTITVSNANPTGTITGQPEAPVEGTEITLTANPSDAGIHDTFSYSWSVTKGGEAYDLGEDAVTDEASISFTPDDNADYLATVTITDNDGGSVDVDSVTMSVANANPTATITGEPDGDINEGDSVTLAANPEDPGAADSFTYAWSVTRGGDAFDLGDTTTDAQSLTFTPTNQGDYVATCVVTDDDGGSVSVDSTTIHANNANPAGTISGLSDGTIFEGDAISLHVDASDPGSEDTLSYSWAVTKDGEAYDLGDATTNAADFSFTPDDNADYVATVTITDGDGGSTDVSTDTISVANANPTGTITGQPEAPAEGTAISLTAHGADAGINDTLSYSWSVTKDGDPYDLGETTTNTADFTFTPNDNGDFVATCTITDNDGGSVDVDSGTMSVANVNPVVSINNVPAGAVGEGAPITVSAHVTDAGSADTVGSYSWSVFKDGEAFTLPESADTTHSSFTFTPTDDGSFTVRLTVVDDDGGATTFDSAAITVTNANPAAALHGGPGGPIAEGTPVSFNVTASDPGAADVLSYEWTVTKGGVAYSLPDGTDVSSTAFTFTPRDNGTYVVKCKVSDDDEGIKTVTSSAITVTNADPTATITGAPEGPIVEGDLVSLTANVTDPGTDDTFTYAWSVTKDGDAFALGDVATDQPTFSVTPPDNGDYVVTCAVTDDDGGSVEVSTDTITVTNAAPTGTITGAPESASEGDAIVLTAHGEDVGVLDTLSYSWAVTKDGDAYDLGETTTNAAAFTFTPNDNGDYVATVTITDNDGDSVDVSTDTIAVANVAPTISIESVPSESVPEGSPITVSANVTDAGAADTVQSVAWSVTKNGEPFDLGETTTNASEFTFTPDDNGEWVISLTVVDDDGDGSSVDSAPITVHNIDPSATVSGAPGDDIVEGTSVTLTANVVKFGVNDSYTYEWSVTKDGHGIKVGDIDTTGSSFTFTPSDNGEFVATCVVTDDDGGHTSADSDAITVTNANPEATISGQPEGEITEGDEVSLTANVTDAGADDSFTYAWTVSKDGEQLDTGDLVTDEQTFTAVASNEGEYVVTVTVTDDDGGIAEVSTDTITVNNANPTGTITGAPETADEGDQITLTANGSDVGPDDVLSYSWAVTKDGEVYDLGETTTDSAEFTFTPNDNGDYVATVTITDGDGGSADVSTDTISVANVAPTVSINDVPETSPEGTAITVSANVSDAGSADTVSAYGWTVYKDEEHFTLPDDTVIDGREFTFTPTDNGSYVIRLTVVDDDGGETTFNSAAITVGNVDPTATISGVPTDSIEEGTAVTLTANPLDAGTDDGFSYEWSVKRGDATFDLGETTTNEASLTFTPTDDGEYVATCVVTDDDGGSVSVDSDAVVVTNANPTAIITGEPENALEGSEITLSVTATDPGTEDTFTYAWSVTKNGDAYDLGEAVTDSDQLSFTPDDNGDYVATCVVMDDNGGTVSVDSQTMAVANVDPTGTVGPTSKDEFHEGDSITFAATPSDAGSADTFTYAWSVTKGGEAFDLGDTATTESTLTFTLQDNGDYVATCTISDDDGGSATASSDKISVANVAPDVTIENVPTDSMTEGDQVTLHAAVTDAGVNDTFSYNWSVEKVGESQPNALIDTPDYTFNAIDNGEYTVTLTVTDNDGGETTQAATITVLNANPTASISGEPDGDITEGTPVSLTASADDAGTLDSFTYAWSVTKNGEDYPTSQSAGTKGSSNDFSFTPDDNGTYVATCVVTDNDGGSVSVSSSEITVLNANPTASITGEPESSIEEGTAVTLTAHADDVGDADVLDYAWTVTKDGDAYSLPEDVVTDGSTLTFTPGDNGTYVATCVVSDDDGGSVSVDSSDIVATNANPTVDLNVPSTGVAGFTTSVVANLSDYGATTTGSLSWDWGDGSDVETLSTPTNETGMTRSHIYSASGTYSVSVTLTDGEGGTITTGASVTVKPVAIMVDPTNSEASALVIGGTNADDTIRMTLNSNGRIKVVINGESFGSFAPTGHVIAFGAGGHNIITMDNSITRPAILYGGTGKDVLMGGGGDDILIGRKGDDALIGNDGRDILFGGLGADSNIGGTGDDILLGGTTANSERFSALAAISAEWTRTDVSALTRIKHLKGTLGGGLNGSTKLNTGSVFADASADVQTGEGGRDWFMSDAADTVTDAVAKQDVTTIVN